VNWNKLPDKDLYPSWRRNVIRRRFHRILDWVVVVAALGIIGASVFASRAEAYEWNDWLEDNTGARAYFDVGVGYQIDSMSDWHVRTERDWQCSQNWEAHFGFGLDWGRASLGYQHQSWWLCGGPFNDRPELYSDRILFNYRFGGK